MKLNVLKGVFTLLFALLICLGSVIAIPAAGGFSLTLQDMFCILAGTVLGGIQGASSVGFFLVTGGLGAPVFFYKTGGFKAISGPYGGFFIGYFASALIAGIIAGTPKIEEKKFSWKIWLRIAAASLSGFLIQYLTGIPWFINAMTEAGKNTGIREALNSTLTLFVSQQIIKFFITIPISAVLRPLTARFIHPDNEVDQVFDQLKKKTDEIKENRS